MTSTKSILSNQLLPMQMEDYIQRWNLEPTHQRESEITEEIAKLQIDYSTSQKRRESMHNMTRIISNINLLKKELKQLGEAKKESEERDRRERQDRNYTGWTEGHSESESEITEEIAKL